ncbi:MAG: 4Fe-4S dicluster domain-containing protein, partial [Promethearchaeota archaeon]
MNRKVLVFEPKKCIGCRFCETICSMTHFNVTNPEKARIRIIREPKSQLDLAFYCHQCSKPPCIEACKFNALSINPDTHAIIVNQENCVACRACIQMCPHGAIQMDPTEENVIICTTCDGNPACVNICPEKAIQYINIERADHVYKSTLVEV